MYRMCSNCGFFFDDSKGDCPQCSINSVGTTDGANSQDVFFAQSANQQMEFYDPYRQSKTNSFSDSFDLMQSSSNAISEKSAEAPVSNDYFDPFAQSQAENFGEQTFAEPSISSSETVSEKSAEAPVSNDYFDPFSQTQEEPGFSKQTPNEPPKTAPKLPNAMSLQETSEAANFIATETDRDTNAVDKGNYSELKKEKKINLIIIIAVAVMAVIVGIVAAVIAGGNKNAEDTIDSRSYSAEDLVTKNLGEIVELMGGDFEIETDGEKLVWYTSPSVYIYNYDALPGFVFYINEANDDWNYNDENFDTIKENIIDGKYEKFSFIALFDGAKLDDEISADMDYGELTEYLGDFGCEVWSDILYAANDKCQLIFEEDKIEQDYSDGSVISPENMREYNPSLKFIMVFPGFEAEYREVDTEETTEEDTTKEKSTEKEITNQKEPTNKGSKKLVFASMPEQFSFLSGAGGWRTYFELEDDGSFTGEYTDGNIDETYICKFSGKFTEPEKIDEYTYMMELEYITYERDVGEVYYEDGIKYIAADAYGFDNPDIFYIYLPGKPKNETPTDFLSWCSIDETLTSLPRFFYGIYNEGGKEGFTGQTDDSVWGKDYICELGNGNISELSLHYSMSSMLILKDEDGNYIDSILLDPCSLFESEAEWCESIVTSKTGDTYGIYWEFTSGYDEITLSIYNYSGNGLPDWDVGNSNTFDGVYTA